MSHVNRLLYAVPAVALAALSLSPVTAAPTPSPSLDRVLAAPPTGYIELTTPALNGQFDAHGWATTVATGSDATATENTLKRDGFVDGYIKAWAQSAAGHGLVEAVMAFNGGQGARKALTALEASDKADVSYKHADIVAGIDPYYGAHLYDPATDVFGDLFVFAKGNDVFFVIVTSPKDDVLSLATDQAKAQFEAAPANTIPAAQWPENRSVTGALPVVGLGAIIVIIVAVVVVVGVLATRRHGTAVPAMVGVVGYGAGPVQLSQDGYYWWDGQAWRDASREVPPTAQRSADGHYWWDGGKWRSMPETPQAPVAEPPSPGGASTS